MKKHRWARHQGWHRLFIAAAVLLGFFEGGLPALGAGSFVHIRQGNRAFEKGDFEKAFEYYTLAEEEHPLSSQAIYQQGAVLYLQGNYHEALEAFQRVTPQDEKLAVLVTYNQGNSLARIGELEEKANPSVALEYYWDSIGAYRRTLSLDPKFWDAAYNIEVVKLRIRNLLEMMNMLAQVENLESMGGMPQQDNVENQDVENEFSEDSQADRPLNEEVDPRDETARDILNEETQRRAEQNLSQGGRSNAVRDW